MRRTQIYLEESMHAKLDRLARARKKTKAEIIRHILDHQLDAFGAEDLTGKGALNAIAKLRMKGGPKNLSRKLDTYLYG